MRRRGRAQDSTEGPDGPRLGYGHPTGSWVSRFDSVVYGLALHPDIDVSGSGLTAMDLRVAQGLAQIKRDEWQAAWGQWDDAVRSGRERLGE